MKQAALVVTLWTVGVAAAAPQSSITPARDAVRQSSVPATTGGAVRVGVPATLSGVKSATFATIRGSALDSGNGVLPNRLVRLRDARAGRIVGTNRTDKMGQFGFDPIDPGSYIVELLGGGETVLAASDLISINADETLTTVVKLPLRMPAGGFLAGHTGQVLAVLSAAATTGVLKASATTDVSPDGTH